MILRLRKQEPSAAGNSKQLQRARLPHSARTCSCASSTGTRLTDSAPVRGVPGGSRARRCFAVARLWSGPSTARFDDTAQTSHRRLHAIDAGDAFVRLYRGRVQIDRDHLHVGCCELVDRVGVEQFRPHVHGGHASPANGIDERPEHRMFQRIARPSERDECLGVRRQLFTEERDHVRVHGFAPRPAAAQRAVGADLDHDFGWERRFQLLVRRRQRPKHGVTIAARVD